MADEEDMYLGRERFYTLILIILRRTPDNARVQPKENGSSLLAPLVSVLRFRLRLRRACTDCRVTSILLRILVSTLQDKEQESQCQGYCLHSCLIGTPSLSYLSDLPERLFFLEGY